MYTKSGGVEYRKKRYVGHVYVDELMSYNSDINKDHESGTLVLEDMFLERVDEELLVFMKFKAKLA
jgi:hypothetical protein